MKYMAQVLLLSLLSHCVIIQDVTDVSAEAKKELGDTFRYGSALNLYVVASNGGEENLQHALSTIQQLYKAMYKDFMVKAPTEPLRVYLFKDRDTYARYNKLTYGKEPSTPFGFYMPGERKMVMNISTGFGTLVHELVHPLIETDFPAVPAWFNEGFASLFEQSYFESDGSIRGDVNWRLPLLQKAIREGNPPPLRSVLETSRTDFYGDGSKLNYASARYLCYYLQQKGNLKKYYKSFRDGVDKDPTGQATLEKILGQSLERFEPTFREFVSGLNPR